MQNIHKLNVLAAGIAIASCGSVVQAGTLGAANEIIVGGATAPQNFMREDLTLRICDAAAAPVQVFVDKVGQLPSTTPGGGILNQGDHFVVRCTAKASFAAPLSGADIAVYKFNGGSATGVAPVSDPDGAAAGDKVYLDANTTDCGAVTGGIGGANAWPIGLSGNTYELYDCANGDDITEAAIVNQDPEAGVSDVEPSIFVGALALDFGNEPVGVTPKPDQPFVDNDNLNVKPGPGLMFGVGVTQPMYDELGRDQYQAGMLSACDAIIGDGDSATPPTFAEWDAATRAQKDRVECMPSMPSTAIRSVFAGQVTDWNDLNPYGLDLDTSAVAEGDNVHLCKRTNGSGTHAQFSINFLGTNCRAASNLAMIEINDGLSSAAFGFTGVYANSGSSDMDDCLDALGDGTGFNGDFSGLPQSAFPDTGDSSVVPGSGLPQSAGVVELSGGPHPLGLCYNGTIDTGAGCGATGAAFDAFGMGYQSLEKNTALSRQWRFVKVDGVAPTLENAVAGDYRDVYYLSYQHRTTTSGGTTPDLRTGGIRTAAATPTQVAVAEEYFKIWNATATEAIAAVNDTLVVDPDGTLGSGDEWQGGYLTPVAGASQAYDGATPATPWARQTAGGLPDSCQDLGLVR